MKKTNSNMWRVGRKCFFENTIVLVFLTRHKEVLRKEHLFKLEKIFYETCLQMKCELLNFEGDSDYVRLTVSVHPTMSISVLTSKLKGKSSYLLSKEFPLEIKSKTVKNSFWSSSYCAVSSGEKSIEKTNFFLNENK